MMKLMIIGRSSIGKTTLMYRLMGCNDFNDDVATQGNVSIAFYYRPFYLVLRLRFSDDNYGCLIKV